MPDLLVDLPANGHHPILPAIRVPPYGREMKAHSLLFLPPFFKSLSSFSRASRDGDVTPWSHFETVDNANPNFLARSSWVKPNRSLIDFT